MADNVFDQFDTAAPPAADSNVFDQFDTNQQPTAGDTLLGIGDAGLSGASHFLVGGLASIARTANRVLPEFIGGNGSEAQTAADIQSLENKLTYDPHTQVGQRIADTVDGVVKPIASRVGSVIGSVVGDSNVPAVMDALATLGYRGPTELIEAGAPFLKAGTLAEAKAADAQARASGLGTAGLVSGSPATQALERTVARLPGAGPLRGAVQAGNDQLGITASDIADNLAAGADTSAQGVGRVLNDQLRAAADRSREVSKQGYDRVSQMLPDNASVPVSNTLGLLQRLSDIPGASATAQALVPSEIKGIYGALVQDVGSSGALPYEALKQLRSSVGTKIDWNPFVSTPTNGMYKAVYAAMGQDMDAGASTFGPIVAAQIAANKASYAKAAATRTTLAGVIDKAGGPEQVYNSLFNSTRKGSSVLDEVLGAVDPPTQRLLAASVLDRMGKAPAGVQNLSGSGFSADAFLTNWNKLSPQARQSLFGSLPGDYANSITTLADNASKLKAYGKVLENRSGTASALAHAGVYGALVEGLLHAGVKGFGHTVGLLGTNRAVAMALTNPATAKYLAKASAAATAKGTSYLGRVYRGDRQDTTAAP